LFIEILFGNFFSAVFLSAKIRQNAQDSLGKHESQKIKAADQNFVSYFAFKISTRVYLLL
jgi:hypothetical protein